MDGGYAGGVPGLEDFEHGIPEENWPAAFALWLAEVSGGPVPRFERVEKETAERDDL